MQRMFRHTVAATFMLIWLCMGSYAVTLTLAEQMNLTTMMETSLSTFRMLQEAKGYDYGVPVYWTGDFSETGWSYSMNGILLGESLSLSMTGSLSGNPSNGETITVTFSGTGTWGSGSISTQGSTVWYYDTQEQGYVRMDYEDSGELLGSWWRWVVRGAEVLGGVVAGVATRNWKVGVTVGTTAWTISDMVFEVVSPPEEPKKPKPDPPPPDTQPGDPRYQWNEINGSNNTIIKIWYPTRGGGQIERKNGGGRVTGQSQAVPEPTTLLLFSCGLMPGLPIIRRRVLR